MRKSILCVANWDSNVGYAWWLMESFWLVIDHKYGDEYKVVLAYPSISLLPDQINDSRIIVEEFDFNDKGLIQTFANIWYLLKNNVRYIYFTDRRFISLRYFIYRLVGVKGIIVHDHTPGLRTPPGRLKKLFKCMLARLPWVSADLVIGATEFVKNRNIEIACLPKDKCVSAPNGVPVLEKSKEFYVDLHNEFEIPEKNLIIVSVGRVSLYKGIDFSLEVIRYLVYEKKVKNLRYIYFGDGPDLEICKDISVEKKIEEYVIFAGRKDNLANYLPSCDIGFHASRGEVGYSLSILEFMRASLPVVVPDNPSVCEATTHGETGLIYKDLDVLSAANALECLIENEEIRMAMKTSSLERVNKMYSLDECHKVFVRHMDGVLK